jgi:hypothetical protein
MLSSGRDTPADHLWKFQLRKENAVLLELLQESKRQQQAADAENKRKIKEGEERLAALEAKEAEYELRKQRELQAFNKDREEVASMKAQMESFLKQQRVSDGLLITLFVQSKLLRLKQKSCNDLSWSNALPTPYHLPPMPQDPLLSIAKNQSKDVYLQPMLSRTLHHQQREAEQKTNSRQICPNRHLSRPSHRRYVVLRRGTIRKDQLQPHLNQLPSQPQRPTVLKLGVALASSSTLRLSQRFPR